MKISSNDVIKKEGGSALTTEYPVNGYAVAGYCGSFVVS